MRKRSHILPSLHALRKANGMKGKISKQGVKGEKKKTAYLFDSMIPNVTIGH